MTTRNRPNRKSLIVVVLTVFAANLSFLGCSMRQMIYPSPAIPVGGPPTGLEEVIISSGDDSKVVAWYRELAMSHGGRPAVLFFHGNGENLETMRMSATFEQLDRLQTPYLVVDYPGYGRSSGIPSERSLKESGLAAMRWLVDQQPDRPLVICGWSLGAAVAIFLAAETDDLDGLIAISAWTSLRDVAKIHFPNWMVGALLRESYDSAVIVETIQEPTLLIHGGRDEIIPVAQGRKLRSKMPRSAWLEVDLAGHNDLLSHPEVWQAIRKFLDLVEQPSEV